MPDRDPLLPHHVRPRPAACFFPPRTLAPAKIGDPLIPGPKKKRDRSAPAAKTRLRRPGAALRRAQDLRADMRRGMRRARRPSEKKLSSRRCPSADPARADYACKPDVSRRIFFLGGVGTNTDRYILLSRRVSTHAPCQHYFGANTALVPILL